MPYRVLSDHLHETAAAAKRHFSRDRGINGLKVEVGIDERIEYAPTFSGTSVDHHHVCIDVAESLSSLLRNNFVSECEKLGLPVRVYVVLPKGTIYADYIHDVKFAQKTGLGVIEIDPATSNAEVLNEALSLSVTGLRNFDMKGYPAKLRQAIQKAVATFKNGEPNKACSSVYDEVEALSRQIALHCKRNGYLSHSIGSENKILRKTGWATLMDTLRRNLDRSNQIVRSALPAQLIAAVYSITPHRNQSGHKPSTRSVLKSRDARLRTRMENAVDLLLELVTAAKAIGLRP